MKVRERLTPATGRKADAVYVTYVDASPYDALEGRIRDAMRRATARVGSDGTYRATTPSVAPIYGEGKSRREALSDLRESCRWLLADPVRISFTAVGRTLTAEVLAERYGGYSVSVPSIPGCFTCGETMEEVRHNVIEAATLMLEETPVRI